MFDESFRLLGFTGLDDSIGFAFTGELLFMNLFMMLVWFTKILVWVRLGWNLAVWKGVGCWVSVSCFISLLRLVFIFWDFMINFICWNLKRWLKLLYKEKKISLFFIVYNNVRFFIKVEDDYCLLLKIKIVKIIFFILNFLI